MVTVFKWNSYSKIVMGCKLLKHEVANFSYKHWANNAKKLCMKWLDVKLMQNPHAMQALLETREKKLVEWTQQPEREQERYHEYIISGVQEHLSISLIDWISDSRFNGRGAPRNKENPLISGMIFTSFTEPLAILCARFICIVCILVGSGDPVRVLCLFHN